MDFSFNAFLGNSGSVLIGKRKITDGMGYFLEYILPGVQENWAEVGGIVVRKSGFGRLLGTAEAAYEKVPETTA